MTQKLKPTLIFMALMGLLLLSACSSATPTATPTIDLNPFRTEVAATVLAQVTQELASTPTVTPSSSPTATVPEAATATPSQEPTLAPTNTVTATAGTPGAGTVDRAKWVSQTVADGTRFAPGETFTMTWRVENVGTSTWTPAYLLRFYSGNKFGAPDEIQLGQEVPPGQTVDITLQMKAPDTPGEYRSDWVLANEKRSNFKEPVFLIITVPAPQTATATSPAATATITPTP